MKPLLDPCSGSRMFYFNKQDDRVLFGDIRQESHVLCDGRHLEIRPDKIMDFCNLPFPDESFYLVSFDPPHLVKCGQSAWMGKKYGILNESTWREDLAKGFAECFRVLKTNHALIFKWNETQIPVKEILALTDQKPVLGHISGKRSNTHWITFLKE